VPACLAKIISIQKGWACKAAIIMRYLKIARDSNLLLPIRGAGPGRYCRSHFFKIAYSAVSSLACQDFD
jgi:hypothetical protein